METPTAVLKLLIDLQKELQDIRDNLNGNDSHIRTRLDEGTDAIDALIEHISTLNSILQPRADNPDTTHRRTLLDTPSPPSV